MATKKKVGVKIPTQSEIMRKYGNIITEASEVVDLGLKLPSSFFALNYALGGGVPYGKILEIAGEESSGKSLLAYDFAHICQELGGHIIWVDAEQAYMNSWAELNGVDASNVTVVNDTRIEVVSDVIADLAIYWRSQLTNNEPILLVVDSIAALDCTDNVDAKMVDGKSEMGGRAKALYKYFRIRNELLYKLGVTQIYINQLRTKLNTGFGQDPSTTPGGAALKFWASIRLQFLAGKQITQKSKGKDRRIGKLVTIRIIKNKVAPPMPSIKQCPVYFNAKYHDVGFDRFFGLADIMIENDIIEKNGASYNFKGKNICRGEENFNNLIATDDKMRRKLLRAAEINTLGTVKKQLNELQENYFPVDGEISYESYNNDDSDEDEEG